jgi:ABC-type antimicrobial peptide transport system permease subunit
LRVEPGVPLDDVRTMNARMSDRLTTRRSPMLLAGIFAGVAIILAAIGIYGVLAYAVSQRRREIGVRMALGAQPDQIKWQFLLLGGRLLAIGTVLGLGFAWFVGRAMSSMLFGVAPAHAGVLAATAAVVTSAGLLASFLPSRRAARVHPIEALRGD